MEVRVVIPEEEYVMAEFSQDGFSGLASLNKSLVQFEPKKVFGWHLSVMFDLPSSDEYGLPLPADNESINIFEDNFDDFLKGGNVSKPNGLFLARIAWNSTVELIWRVYQPAPVDEKLQFILEKKDYPAPFDYKISQDLDWSLADWHLKVADKRG